jgi:acid phosphatase
LPPVTKLLVFVEENHSLDGMRAGMPYTASLAERYGYATDYHAVRHPSLPNYVAIAGGSTYGIADDLVPARHRLGGRSVFGQALRHHRSAATYAESMPSPCRRTNAGPYAPKHNPWTYFAGERPGCRAHDRAMGAFASDVAAGRLPRVGMVVPNLRHDAHNGSLGTADAWFRTQMTKVFAGPDWRSGRLAVVLTADEDDRTQDNTVLTVVIHPSQQQHVVSTPLTHYSLTRLYEDVAGTSYLDNAATAPSLASAFGLPLS